MREITTEFDEMRGYAVFEISKNQHVTLDRKHVDLVGIEGVMRELGLDQPVGRIPVFQSGREVGSVPASFDPKRIKSTSWLYDPRPGDFKWEGDRLIADRMLGPGDLAAVPGFSRHP